MDIKAIVSQMTLEEKASLLSGLDFWHTKPVERLGVESVMMSDGPHGLRKQSDAAKVDDVNASIEAVCFPAGSASAASFDTALHATIGEAIGDSCRHERLAVVLGPAVNIKRSPLCGRNFEYYSEDPLLAGESAAAYILGVQSKNVGTSVKHFALNNQEHRRMSASSEADERTMREIYLAPFETAVKKAMPWTVMCSYNRVNGVYASENPLLLTEILRNEWGFDGYVVSDWGAVSERVAGVAAGLDLEMPASAGVNDRLVVEAVQSGKLDEAAVDRAVERILEVNGRYLAHAKPDTLWDLEAQHALARKLAAECMVLLKNEGGILPLQEGAKVAAIGAFAKEPRFQGGGSSHINCFKTESFLDATADMPNVVYAKGYHIDTEDVDAALVEEAVSAARAAEFAVVFAGLPDSFESEGYDRAHMRMPANQNALIEAVAEANPNTIVVLHNGSPVEMSWLNRVRGVIEAYLGGQAVGGAAADVLYGRAEPCGRLPETFPIKLEDNPSYLYFPGNRLKSEYREGIFVGYRYYDKKKMEVLFPFGFGLSYTSFAYSNLCLGARELDEPETLEVSVDVTNTGARAGKETVQLYVKNPQGESNRPVRELRAFAKVFLMPGETKTVRFTLTSRAFSYWNEEIHDWLVEDGEYGIEIARSSRDIVLARPVTVRAARKVREKYTLDSIFMDIMADPRAKQAMEPYLRLFLDQFSAEEGGEGDVGRSAISEEMSLAMMRYMPLRASLSFSAGKVTRAQLLALVDALNAE